MNTELLELARLLRQRNAVDEDISRLIGRPALPGHIGEYIAAALFDIDLNASASQKACDGIFRSGPLEGKTVNVKCYGKQEGILDVGEAVLPDYYLVLTGPIAAAVSSRGTSRLTTIDRVYIFRAEELQKALQERKVKIGVATSVANRLWHEAEIWPDQTSTLIPLTQEQREALAQFKSAPTRKENSMPSITRVTTPYSYSSAVAAGEYVFVGLHRGWGETFAEQLESTFVGLSKTLGALGLTLESLVKVNVWLKNVGDLPEMEKRFSDHFAAGAFPARMTATTEFIDADCLLMIDGVAYRGKQG